jgi:hypothetical protein
MKAIEISIDEFLVNIIGEVEEAQISGYIVSISKVETHSTACYGGGSNENVPVYGFVPEEVWEENSKKFQIIDLGSRPDLKMFYEKVHNAFEDKFESESDFLFDHVNDYWR